MTSREMLEIHCVKLVALYVKSATFWNLNIIVVCTPMMAISIISCDCIIFHRKHKISVANFATISSLLLFIINENLIRFALRYPIFLLDDTLIFLFKNCLSCTLSWPSVQIYTPYRKLYWQYSILNFILKKYIYLFYREIWKGIFFVHFSVQK